MHLWNSLVVVLILVSCTQFGANNVKSKRISEMKCDANKLLEVDEMSQHPHLVDIFEESNRKRRGNGVLVSADFVLMYSTARNQLHMNNNLLDLRIRKLKLIGEAFPNNENFSIKRIISRDNEHSGIVLLQLEQPLSIGTRRSIFRPACLWTNTNSSFEINSYRLLQSSYMIRSNLFRTAALEDCNTHRGDYLCLKTTNETLGLISSPVEIESNYIIGFVSEVIAKDAHFFFKVFKISGELDWIESIVWPNNTSFQCGQRIVKHKPLMTFAQPTYNGEFPWQVALFKVNRNFICGGTIIGTVTILSAAHCVHDQRGVVPANRLIVLAGTHTLYDYSIDARYYAVKTVIVHENYNKDYLENDITVLKLACPIEYLNYIQPICVSNSLDYTNIRMGTVAGWGRNEHHLPSDVLLQATLPVVDYFECRDSNREFFNNYLNPNNYCAGYDNGTSVCSGDSGSAMVFQYNSQWYIRGIVSMGVALQNSNQCDVTQFVLFTDVSKFYDWLIDKLEDEQ